MYNCQISLIRLQSVVKYMVFTFFFFFFNDLTKVAFVTNQSRAKANLLHEETEGDQVRDTCLGRGKRDSVYCPDKVTGTPPQAAKAVAWIALYERQLSIPFHLNAECRQCSWRFSCVTFSLWASAWGGNVLLYFPCEANRSHLRSAMWWWKHTMSPSCTSRMKERGVRCQSYITWHPQWGELQQLQATERDTHPGCWRAAGMNSAWNGQFSITSHPNKPSPWKHSKSCFFWFRIFDFCTFFIL